MSVNEQSCKDIEMYQKVKGGLIAKGDSVTAWCKRNGTSVSNLRQAFYGSWNGERAKELRNKVIEEAGSDN